MQKLSSKLLMLFEFSQLVKKKKKNTLICCLWMTSEMIMHFMYPNQTNKLQICILATEQVTKVRFIPMCFLYLFHVLFSYVLSSVFYLGVWVGVGGGVC